MKFLKISGVFLLASLLQWFIVFIGERTGISQFDIQFTPFRLIHHLLAGQVLGYALFALVTYFRKLKRMPAVVIGILFGSLAWAFILFTGTKSGLIQSSWLQTGGITTTLLAFMVYGVIVGITVFRMTPNRKI